ncbi:MAG TPA: ATP-binding cassette domain-containing protein, partial [Opitutales bacterium]|nr:ATP-binding cassette domain-containing protein [Opitutales bacterium]
LQDFLFSPARARSPVKILSGGERNRLLLARLFTRPANLLVLDEPTNDLDAETLELLEALLVEYQGTLLVVSHDRAFLNNVATSLFVFENDGRIIESIGGYDDYVRLKERTAPPQLAALKTEKQAKPTRRPARPRRMTNRELRELENLPAQIEKLEQRQKQIAEELADPALYQEGAEGLTEKQSELEEIENELAAAFDRWEELETLQAELSE